MGSNMSKYKGLVNIRDICFHLITLFGSYGSLSVQSCGALKGPTLVARAQPKLC